MKTKRSNISKFYKKSIQERQDIIQNWGNLSTKQVTQLKESGLSTELANNMIENVIGRYSLPLSIATNFLINGKDYLIPMVIEEPSVIAACSFAAKLFREGGGFTTHSDNPIMIGQIQLLDVSNTQQTIEKLISHKTQILNKANEKGGSIISRGGGAVDLQIRLFEDTPAGDMIIIHLLYNTVDAMGANAINTAVEYISPYIEELTGGRVNLKILSNLSDQRKAYAKGMIPHEHLASESYTGREAVKYIVEAGIFAEIDPYRATTHNKGIMNGIDAVLLATGNDWRAIEAGAHAYAARSGTYTSLTKWWADNDGNLHGSIEVPMALGIVGGATRVHENAKTALQILGIESAQHLAEITVAVGLAQNFAAIRALATEGIQHGHMRMHARQLAVAAGATTDMVPNITRQLIEEKNIRLERAKELVKLESEKEIYRV
jgi:hydroxymethylglutaryl-CoA reductase